MRRLLRWGVLIFMGLGLTATSLQAQKTTGCQRYRLASLPIAYDRGNRPLIDVLINDAPLRMLVDTGGVDSVLSWNAVERLKLPKQLLDIQQRVYDAEGVPIVYSTTVDKFSIGVMYGTHWPFMVSPEHTIALGDDDTGGILGPDILLKYDIEFDFGSGKFNIFTHDDCPGRVVYWSMQPYGAVPFTMDGFHIVVHAKLDGEDVDVLIDTGASMSNMTDKTLGEILPAPPDPARMKPVDNGKNGGDDWYTYAFKTLDLNGLLVQNPVFFVMPEHLAALHNISQSRPTVILGMSMLRSLHLYIAYRDKMLYFTPADAR